MAKKQTREELGVKAGDQIVIAGTVSYSHIVSYIEGDQLAAWNSKLNPNQMQQTRPFKIITIDNPRVVSGQGSPLAKYYEERFGVRKSGDKAGQTVLSLETKSPFPLRFYHKNQKIEPTAEFGTGQEVNILISAFQPKNFPNMSSAPDAIMIPTDEIKYFAGEINDLAAFGLTPPENMATVAAEPAQTDGVDIAAFMSADDTPQPVQPVNEQPNTATPETPPTDKAMVNPFASQ